MLESSGLRDLCWGWGELPLPWGQVSRDEDMGDMGGCGGHRGTRDMDGFGGTWRGMGGMKDMGQCGGCEGHGRIWGTLGDMGHDRDMRI